MNVKTKQLLLSFSMQENDRLRQVDRARKELAKGTRVDLVIANKSAQKAPRYKEITLIAQNLVEELADAGEEYKAREVKGKSASIFLKPVSAKEGDADTAHSQEPEV